MNSYCSQEIIEDIPLKFTWRNYCTTSRWVIYSISYGNGNRDAKDSFPVTLLETIDSTVLQLKSWLKGELDKLPIDRIDMEGQIENLTENQMKVLTTLYEVPKGKIISYKELGIKAGFGPNSAMFIGNTMHINPWPLFIPCHRVVLSSNKIGNYSLGGVFLKERLLKMEGIIIKNGICYEPKCN